MYVARLTQMFVVFEGAVEVLVHRTKFVIAPGGMFCVPMGNTYNIRNVSQRDARLFFAQARNMYAPLTPVLREGQTVFSHGDAVRAVHDLQGAPGTDAAERAPPVRAEPADDDDDDEAYQESASENEASASDDEYDVSHESS